MEELKEATTTVQKDDSQSSTEQQNILFGSITYADDTAYDEFISTMNVNQAVFVLVASANFAHTKGAFNLLESETLSAAIRTIRRAGEKKEDSPQNQ
jgi:hypothetical protein